MNLLLVEDEADIASFMKRGLSAEGWTVTVAADGESALELLKTQGFAIVLIDFALPGLDGYGVVAALRQAGDLTPVIVLSALDQDDERLSALAGFDVVSLRKPFDFDVLLAHMKTASDNKAAE